MFGDEEVRAVSLLSVLKSAAELLGNYRLVKWAAGTSRGKL
jgi:hypothetical protein